MNPVDAFPSHRPSPSVQLCASADIFIRENEASLSPLLKTAVLPTQNWEASLLDLDVEVLDIINSPKVPVAEIDVINVQELMFEECGNLFKNQKELQDHFNTEHRKPQVSTVTSEEDAHKCEDCD